MDYTQIKKRIETLNVFKYITLFFLLMLLISFVFSVFVNLLEFFHLHFDMSQKPLKNFQKGINLFLLVSVIAPVFETFIAQYLPIKLLKGRMPNKIIIFLSAMIFGLLHWYNLLYVIHTFLIGLVLAVAYVCWNKQNILHPFWIVCIIHCLKNVLSFIIN